MFILSFVPSFVGAAVIWLEYCIYGVKHKYNNQSIICFTGNKKLSESCEADIQCSGAENAGVCGKDGTCSCSTGYLNLQQNCIQGKRILHLRNFTL